MKKARRSFYEKFSAPLIENRVLTNRLLVVNYLLTAFIGIAYFILLWDGVIKREPYTPNADLNKILLLPFSCLLFTTILRQIVNRKRPYENGEKTALTKKTRGHSFPSRHLACAFVIGVIYLFYLLPVGILLLCAGLALGVLRYLFGIHYFSDVFFGACIGTAFGLLALFL